MSSEIRYESADGIATITIDRPAKRNALTSAMCEDLHAAWRRFAASDEERVAILTAAGNDVFTAGADLNDPPPRFWQAVLTAPTNGAAGARFIAELASVLLAWSSLFLLGLALRHHRRLAVDGNERGIRGAAEKPVQLVQLPALPLPSDPLALLLVPQTPAMQTPADAPMEKVQPMDAKSIEAEKHHLEEAQKRQAEQDKKNAEAKKVVDKKAAQDKAATGKKAAEQQAIADKKAAEQRAAADKKAAAEKAIADKKAADDKAVADKKAAEAKAQQQRLDDERAAREAEVAKKNAEADRKAQEEQKKREKTLADAAERLRQAQAAYQAEIDKAKGGSNDKSKSGVQ